MHVIVGFPPAGVGDIIARLMGQCLSERLGQPFIIENRPGAGSTLAVESVVKATPDGYTLLWISSANPISTTLYNSLSFNFIRDIRLITSIAEVPLVMEVHPSVPTKTVPEFITYAKANPGKINWASGRNGIINQLPGELFKTLTGVNMLQVLYRGTSLALTDLISGRMQVLFDNLPSSIVSASSPSFEYVVSHGEQRLRNAETEQLGGLEVYGQLKLGGLFDRDVAGLRPTQNLVDHFTGAPE